MNTKHTPGPWVWDERHTALDGAGGQTVLADGTGRWPVVGTDADASLIAAAPALLEALEMVRDAEVDWRSEGWTSMPDRALEKLNRLIALATGGAA